VVGLHILLICMGIAVSIPKKKGEIGIHKPSGKLPSWHCWVPKQESR